MSESPRASLRSASGPPLRPTRPARIRAARPWTNKPDSDVLQLECAWYTLRSAGNPKFCGRRNRAPRPLPKQLPDFCTAGRLSYCWDSIPQTQKEQHSSSRIGLISERTNSSASARSSACDGGAEADSARDSCKCLIPGERKMAHGVLPSNR